METADKTHIQYLRLAAAILILGAVSLGIWLLFRGQKETDHVPRALAARQTGKQYLARFEWDRLTVRERTEAGESLVMPAKKPHAVYAPEDFKMLLLVVFPPETP